MFYIMISLVDEKNSNWSGFYKLKPEERLNLVATHSGLSDDEKRSIDLEGGLKMDLADRMIENVIGFISMPMGVAMNFLVNSKEYLVPMATEEPSIVAAASNAAKMTRSNGGFRTSSTPPVMIGQIQVIGVADPNRARLDILSSKEKILSKANEQDPMLVSLGGGAKDLDARVIESAEGPMIIVGLHVNCKDAMGANAVNTMCEAVAPLVEEITSGQVLLRIITNLAVKRLVRASAVFSKDDLGGEQVVKAIMKAYAFAFSDPYRCTTHNKGIMNGIIAVALATAQDHRAIEAGAHAYACRDGEYLPLTNYEINSNGDLVGTIELPMAIGLIGGATASHPTAKAAVKILGTSSSNDLAEVIAAVGLAQNLAALRALSVEGIQRGHMKLHARNVAVSAGASGPLIDKVAQIMVSERKIRFDRAKEILSTLS